MCGEQQQLLAHIRRAFLQLGGESSQPFAAQSKGDPAAGPSCVLEYQCGELVAFGFAQNRERKPELMCIAAGLQLGDELVDLGDELVDLGCLPIAV